MINVAPTSLKLRDDERRAPLVAAGIPANYFFLCLLAGGLCLGFGFSPAGFPDLQIVLPSGVWISKSPSEPWKRPCCETAGCWAPG